MVSTLITLKDLPSRVRGAEDYEKNLDGLMMRTANSTCIFMNPRVPDMEDLRKLFIYAYEGKKVDF